MDKEQSPSPAVQGIINVQGTFSKNMYSAPSLPWMVSLRGRCFEVMTCSCGANAAMVTTGSVAVYVPGTASSRPCE